MTVGSASVQICTGGITYEGKTAMKHENYRIAIPVKKTYLDTLVFSGTEPPFESAPKVKLALLSRARRR